MILRFVNERNAPVNVQLVADFMQTSKIGKTQVVKSLDALAESGRIQEKTFGTKTKVYFANQDPADDASPEELAALREQLKSESATLAKLTKELAAARLELKRLEAEPTTSEARLLLGEHDLLADALVQP